MKLVKSLLLGSAAGLVAVAGASAADLGVKKPSAVEYVKTCPTYGAGFFVVPGTTSCLKIVGRIRADYGSGSGISAQITHWSRAGDSNTFRARGYLGFDHRTATEYGLLRAYTRFFIGRDNAGAMGPYLEYAFIQFGGLTAGRVAPVFEHGWSFAFQNQVGTSDNTYVNSLGYTFNAGKFSATLALDAAAERRSHIGAVTVTTPFGAAAPASLAGTGYAGQAMPDIVAKLAYDDAWGSVYLAGAVHQIRSVTPTIDTAYGFAGSLGAKFNLPFLAKGSNFWIAGTYADGAVSYLAANTIWAGNVNVAIPDAQISGTSLKKTSGWGIAGGIQAYVTPTIWVGLTGGYVHVDPFGAANAVRGTQGILTAGWTPAAGFLIGAEVGVKSIAYGSAIRAVVPAGTDKTGFFGRLRFQRDF